MKKLKRGLVLLLVLLLTTGCGKDADTKQKADSSKNEAEQISEEQTLEEPSEDSEVADRQEDMEETWYRESIKEHNAKEKKVLTAYDLVDGEKQEDTVKTYECESVEIPEEASGLAEVLGETGMIDLTYVTDYEVVGEEEMDGRNLILLKMTEEGYLTAAEIAENEMGEELERRLKESEELQKAYDNCLAEQSRDIYIGFDAETKVPVWVETDVTRNQIFSDLLEGIIAEVPEEELNVIRVTEFSEEAETEELDKAAGAGAVDDEEEPDKAAGAGAVDDEEEPDKAAGAGTVDEE